MCHGSVSKDAFLQHAEHFHSRDQRPFWFAKANDDFCVKIEFNFHQYGHQYGRRVFYSIP